jgi:hypothetical protein
MARLHTIQNSLLRSLIVRQFITRLVSHITPTVTRNRLVIPVVRTIAYAQPSPDSIRRRTKMKKYIVRLVLIAAFIAPIAAASLSQEASCPYDGEQAQKISEVQVSVPSCPGVSYNAAEATYSHLHINGPLLEKHTFSKTECLK